MVWDQAPPRSRRLVTARAQRQILRRRTKARNAEQNDVAISQSRRPVTYAEMGPAFPCLPGQAAASMHSRLQLV
jgi:hypothetical protein